MGYDEFYPYDEESAQSQATPDDVSKESILQTIESQKIVTDRELKVRLEKQFFPWVIGRELKKLLESNVVKKVKLPGRRSVTTRTTEAFFCLEGTKYDDIEALMKQKKEVTNTLNSFLTGTSPAADHSEDLFHDAFGLLNFKIHGRSMSEFNGRKVTGIPGKELPNLDFIIERDKLVYGVDIKNWIRYETDNRTEIKDKTKLALELKTIPFMVTRYADKEIIFQLHDQSSNHGMTYRYNTLLLPSSLDSLAKRAAALLGYPILAVDRLPAYKIKWIEKLHQIRLKK